MHTPGAFYLCAIAFWTVGVAELVGDKSLYTIASLAARFRAGLVLAGIAIAYMAKMFAAVIFGSIVTRLKPEWVSLASAVTFFITAYFLWSKQPRSPSGPAAHVSRWRNPLLISFAAIFFSEWGDVGQVSAATLVARYSNPGFIWLGATGALLTKGALVLTLGLGMRRHLSVSLLRTLAGSSCLVLGCICLGELVWK